MRLSGLSAGLWTKGSLVGFPVGAHAQVVGQVPSGGCTRGNHTLTFLSLSLSLPSPLSKNKENLKKKDCFPWFQHLLKIIIVNISVQSTSSYTERTQLRQWRILATKGKPEGAGRRHSYTKGKLHYHKMVIKYYHCLKNLFPLLNH